MPLYTQQSFLNKRTFKLSYDTCYSHGGALDPDPLLLANGGAGELVTAIDNHVAHDAIGVPALGSSRPLPLLGSCFLDQEDNTGNET